MTTLTLAPSRPVSSGEILTVDPQRADVVDRRHQQLAELLAATSLDAVLLRRPASFAWLSAGGDSTFRGTAESSAAAFVTPEARVVLCNGVDTGQFFDRELNGMGFQLKERPWHQPREILLQDLCRGRRVGSDTGEFGTENVEERLVRLRCVLSNFDLLRLRDLSRAVAHAVEATARTFSQGETEAEIAGQLAHRLLKHDIEPVQLQVLADGQGQRYRHWAFGHDRVERTCILRAIGRAHGLHAGVTRTVTFGVPPRSIRDTHQLATLVQSTGMFFSQAGWKLEDTWERVVRIYEKYGAPEEWRRAEQGRVLGYAVEEVPVTPQNRFRLQSGCAMFWHPSVLTAAVGDTILIRDEGFEILTAPDESWPKMTVEIKGMPLSRPAILVRESATDWPDA
jgi:Xaa-Pro aminopeptidase